MQPVSRTALSAAHPPQISWPTASRSVMNILPSRQSIARSLVCHVARTAAKFILGSIFAPAGEIQKGIYFPARRQIAYSNVP